MRPHAVRGLAQLLHRGARQVVEQDGWSVETAVQQASERLGGAVRKLGDPMPRRFAPETIPC
jgi:hypothetical protein